MIYPGRAGFCTGDAHLTPAISLRAIGRHSMGLQCVRVNPVRGRVVLASDVTHSNGRVETGRPHATAFHLGAMLEHLDHLRAIGPSAHHIVPGHDPEGMCRNPSAPVFDGTAVELHRSSGGSSIGAEGGAHGGRRSDAVSRYPPPLAPWQVSNRRRGFSERWCRRAVPAR